MLTIIHQKLQLLFAVKGKNEVILLPQIIIWLLFLCLVIVQFHATYTNKILSLFLLHEIQLKISHRNKTVIFLTIFFCFVYNKTLFFCGRLCVCVYKNITIASSSLMAMTTTTTQNCLLAQSRDSTKKKHRHTEKNVCVSEWDATRC